MFKENIIDPFLEVMKKHSNLNAFCINERYYTYGEFGKAIAKVVRAINGTNLSGTNIGLVVNDDIETYASIFAIWLEGLAFVPLHPNQPISRGLEIIQDAEVCLVLDSSEEKYFDSVPTILTNDLVEVHPELTAEVVSCDSLAYILFTSGSTGRPKGVQITRKNIGTFIWSFWKTAISLNQSDRCLQCFDLTFDVSIQSFLAPLTKGACVYTIPHNQIKYSYVYGLLEKHRLTFGAMAPSMIRYLKPYFDEIDIPSMRCNILTAEASPLSLVQEWAECIPNAEIFNFYGPTEATIYCTYQKYNRNSQNKQLNGMLSIGKAMPGIEPIIISNGKQILKSNEKGELCVSGDQITPGYWKNIRKTEAAFINLNIDGAPIRFYRTGDLCYMDDDGDIMLSGRIDHQVKIQGYRIELGEIEYHAREYLKGRNVVASTFNNKSEVLEIALFVEGFFDRDSDLINYLNNKLPNYMIPSKILSIETFPINTSGKVDRMLLKGKLGNINE